MIHCPPAKEGRPFSSQAFSTHQWESRLEHLQVIISIHLWLEKRAGGDIRDTEQIKSFIYSTPNAQIKLEAEDQPLSRMRQPAVTAARLAQPRASLSCWEEESTSVWQHCFRLQRHPTVLFQKQLQHPNLHLQKKAVTPPQTLWHCFPCYV